MNAIENEISLNRKVTYEDYFDEEELIELIKYAGYLKKLLADSSNTISYTAMTEK